jgi:glutamine cyclotransferase
LSRGAVVAAAALLVAAVAAPVRAELPSPHSPRLPVRVLATHPHDSRAFTQGLVFHAGKLYESTGLEGESRVREVELATGRVLRETALGAREFGEGLARVGDRLVQLTWRDGVAHLWRLADFAPLGTLRYAGEGWGLAWDGEHLIQSDGSDRLVFRRAEDFSVARTLAVTRDGEALAYLNELEAAGGALYANVWMSDEIVRIDPVSGRVTATYDASGLLAPEEARRAEVLNGIAFDPARGVFFLTGKWWPRLFEVALDPPPAPVRP